MSITLGSRSLSRLEGVHPDLVRVVKRAAASSDLDFTVLEGLPLPSVSQDREGCCGG